MSDRFHVDGANVLKVLGMAAATLISGIILVLVTGGWSSKESVAGHKASIDSVRMEQTVQFLQLKGGMQSLHADLQRILDVQCDQTPNTNLCKNQHPTP